jgi:hypothetical protein
MRKWAARLAVVVLAGMCSGCAYMISNWPPWLDLTPPQRHQYVAARRQYSTRRERSAARNRRAPRTAATSVDDSESVAEPDAASAPPAVSTAPANLTLAGEGKDRDRARRLLESVDSKLDKVHSRSLNGSDKEAYDRANQLAIRAHRALDNRNYAAASSLATKASSLANGIGSSGF